MWTALLGRLGVGALPFLGRMMPRAAVMGEAVADDVAGAAAKSGLLQRFTGLFSRSGSTLATEATTVATEGAKKGILGKALAMGTGAATTVAGGAAAAFWTVAGVVGTVSAVALTGALVLGAGYLVYKMFSGSGDEQGQNVAQNARQQGVEISPQLGIPSPALEPSMGVPVGNAVSASYPAAVGYTNPQVAMAQPAANWVTRVNRGPVDQGVVASVEQRPVVPNQQGV